MCWRGLARRQPRPTTAGNATQARAGWRQPALLPPPWATAARCCRQPPVAAQPGKAAVQMARSKVCPKGLSSKASAPHGAPEPVAVTLPQPLPPHGGWALDAALFWA